MKKYFLAIPIILTVGLIVWYLGPQPSNYVYTGEDVKELSPNQPPAHDHVRFQTSFFREINRCNQTRQNILNTYSLIFKLPLNLFNKKVRFVVKETVSGNEQEIVYDGKSFTYLKFNNGEDFTELMTIEACKKMDPCPFIIRLMTQNWKNISPEVEFTLQGFDAEDATKLLVEKKYEREPNLLFNKKIESDSWPEFLPSYKSDQKKIELLISKKHIMDALLKANELYVVTQTKNKIDQVEFDRKEYDVNLNDIDKRFEGDYVAFREPKNDPAYFGAVYYILNKNFAIEYVQIAVNKADTFYECKD